MQGSKILNSFEILNASLLIRKWRKCKALVVIKEENCGE